MSEIPTKIGKYEIVREVGRRSMGTLCKANASFSHRSIAIKVAHAQYAKLATEDGERFRKLFFNEPHAASGLGHPNILKVFDADVDGDLCYPAMEFVHNAQTLEEFGNTESLLPLREVVGIICERKSLKKTPFLSPNSAKICPKAWATR